MSSTQHKQQNLLDALNKIGPAGIAVSGGVDSMTLAYIAARHTKNIKIFHAVSPAVPEQATERVKQHAQGENWQLQLINAGEFDDPDYRANPINRCYYCKTNLYGEIKKHTQLTILSGTNCDDLNDFRPGLGAASELNVKHPFVEAGIYKSDIRQLARKLGLDKLAALPAGPCLSSRILTGLPINPKHLETIDQIETFLMDLLGEITIRCRLNKDGYQIQLDENVYASLQPNDIQDLLSKVKNSIHPTPHILGISAYAQGSAFIGKKSHA